MCSPVIDSRACDVKILYDFVTSDHNPLQVVFTALSALNSNPCSTACQQMNTTKIMPDWTKADGANLQLYHYVLDKALCDVSLPVELLIDNNMMDEQHKHMLIDT